MENNVEVTVNGRTFIVKTGGVQKDIDHLEEIKKEYLDGQRTFNPLWKETESNKEDVLADLEKMKAFLQKIDNNPDKLTPDIKSIRKKKNGGFWKNSGADVYVAEHCTDYFTEYTNAWSTLLIRLDVIDENTCELSVRNRTFTH